MGGCLVALKPPGRNGTELPTLRVSLSPHQEPEPWNVAPEWWPSLPWTQPTAFEGQ